MERSHFVCLLFAWILKWFFENRIQRLGERSRLCVAGLWFLPVLLR